MHEFHRRLSALPQSLVGLAHSWWRNIARSLSSSGFVETLARCSQLGAKSSRFEVIRIASARCELNENSLNRRGA